MHLQHGTLGVDPQPHFGNPRDRRRQRPPLASEAVEAGRRLDGHRAGALPLADGAVVRKGQVGRVQDVPQALRAVKLGWPFSGPRRKVASNCR